MARITTYATDVTIHDADKVIGTDGVEGVNNGKTKNYTVSELKSYINAGVNLLGWARYDDTVYTVSNKLALTDGVVVTLPNNAGNVVSSPSAPTFYNSGTQKLQATGVGNVYMLTVVFKASAANANTTHLDFKMSGPGEFDRINKALSFYKANDATQSFHEVYQYYSDQDFVDNGVTLTINSDGGTANVWDIIYFVQKTQQAN
jgi:hypothetical protein